jgi:hypothetical protein
LYFAVQYWESNFDVIIIGIGIYVSSVLLGGPACPFLPVKITGITEEFLVFEGFRRRQVLSIEINQFGSDSVRRDVKYEQLIVHLVLANHQLVTRKHVA